jgi:hypothetical protein
MYHNVAVFMEIRNLIYLVTIYSSVIQNLTQYIQYIPGYSKNDSRLQIDQQIFLVTNKRSINSSDPLCFYLEFEDRLIQN